MIWFIGGSTACMPAHFIFAANRDPLAASIFQLLGGIFLAIAAVLLIMNKSASSNDQNNSPASVVHGLLLICIINMVVMTILGQTIRF